MVNNLIFRAADASTALENVQDALGPDAYIIDINNVGNFVEIVASKDEPVLQKSDKPVNPRKSLALAKRKLEQFVPELPLKPLGGAAYMNAPGPDPVMNTTMRENGQVSGQQDLFTENVFREDSGIQNDLPKPLEFGTHASSSDAVERTESVTPNAPIVDLKPSSMEDKHRPLNAASPMLSKRRDTFVFGDLINLD